MVTIDYTLQNGDIVEIVTSANSAGSAFIQLKIIRLNAETRFEAGSKKKIHPIPLKKVRIF